MANVDIASETMKVGNALTSVRLDTMILNLAKGIAWGQYELDKVGVEITKMMGVPGTVSIGGEKLSMLEAGFIPSFYHFVDTILELKMEVKIREEQNSSTAFSTKSSVSSESEAYGEVSGSVSYDGFFVSAEMGFKAGYKQKSTAAYSTALDTKQSQTFSQDLSASSLMRTKLVPVPPPETLVERIKILLERLREEAKDEDAAQVVVMLSGKLAAKFDHPGDGTNKADIISAFASAEKQIALSEINVTAVTSGWKLDGIKTVPPPAEGQQQTTTQVSYFIEKSGDQLKVYDAGQQDRKSMDQMLLDKVSQKILERVG